MFFWNFVGHDLLPLGEAGMSKVPNEDEVAAVLKTNLTESGLYKFPWYKAGPTASRQERTDAMNKAMEKVATGPSGFLVYHSTRKVVFGKLLGTEFAAELVEVFLVVVLLLQTRIASFAGRVGFALTAGILAAITTNVSYWNWDGFPTVYTLAYMTIQVVGFLCAGIIVALVLGRARTAP